MNIHAARWVVALALLAVASAAEAEYEEYEDVPAVPVKSSLRPSPLLRQARGPVIGRPGPKATVTQKTTTTEAPPPLEYEDEELDEEAIEEEQPTTTTEAPKKAGVKTGMVRPFRSNTDLIEALKRRRQQQSSSNSSPTTTTQQPTSEKSYKGGRRASSSNKIPAADQTGSNSERKPTVNGRRFSGRPSNGKVTTSAEPPPEVEAQEEQPQRSRLFGRGRRF